MIAADKTKARLLAAARDSFLEVGPAKFSLRDVARRTGVSAAAVYRHFEDKDALFGAVCGQALELFYAYLVKALAAKTPRARIELCTMQYLRFGLDNRRDYRLIFMGDGSQLRDGPYATEDRGPTYQFLMDRVRECMDAGDFRVGDIDQTAATIWAHVHGLVSLRLAGQLGNLSEARFASFYKASTKQLLNGLAK
ncbi:MAG: TetR/AcrR family transcriptional regulator [Polyangiaceae bacterium]